MKKYLLPALAALLLGGVGFGLFTIERQIQALTLNTQAYVVESNKVFETIICQQQIPGNWDLSKCPR